MDHPTKPRGASDAEVPPGLIPLLATAQTAERRLSEVPGLQQHEAHVEAWEAVVAHRLFREAAGEARCVLQGSAGRARLQRYRDSHVATDLYAATLHFELASMAVSPGQGVRLEVLHDLALALRLSQDPDDLERAIETLRAAAAEAAIGTPLRAMILQTLVETLVQHEPDEVDQEWAQRLVEAIQELLTEVPEQQETRKQRAVLLTHQGAAHMMLSFAPGAKVRESQRAVGILREAQRLMAEVGDEQGMAFVADHLDGAEQLLAIAEREDHPRAMSLDEVVAWVDAERDPHGRVERLQRLLAEGTMQGGTAEGAALYRLDLASRLLREIENTTFADVELVISVAEQALSTLNEHSNPPLAFVGHNVLGVAYMIRAAGERAANLEFALSHLERSLQLNPFERPEDQAELLLNIAFVLKDRSGGDRSQNMERALECARAALDAWRGLGDVPKEAAARMILGVLYGERIEGRSDQNSDRALAELTRAIELLDSDRDRVTWGSAQHNLARVYAARRWMGASEENLRRAIYHYRLSLAAHPRAERPYDWATSQLTLANAYSQLAGEVGNPLAGQEFLQQADSP